MKWKESTHTVKSLCSGEKREGTDGKSNDWLVERLQTRVSVITKRFSSSLKEANMHSPLHVSQFNVRCLIGRNERMRERNRNLHLLKKELICS